MPCGDYDDVFCNFHDKWCFICRQYSASRELINRGRFFGNKKVMLCSPCRDVVFGRFVLCARTTDEIIRNVESCFDNENEARRALEIVLEPRGIIIRGGKPPDKCDILLI